MIHSWIQTNFRTNGATAYEMRFNVCQSSDLCPSVENSNYQTKPNGLDRLGRKI
ncbi:hypothetical protein BH10ACI1_BH10ACI1_25500 [soil metagenome]